MFTPRWPRAEEQPLSASILMIDDDVGLTELVRDHLAHYRIAVDPVHSGEEGLERLRSRSYALVILDVMLPLMNGFETLSHLRQFSTVPVLMLTARGNPMDIALGFRMGSDDYLAKPFGAEELALRIQAILRRCYPQTAVGSPAAALCGDRLNATLDDIELVPGLRRVFQNGVEVHLTCAEFDILRGFFESPGEIVSREELCRLALGRDRNPFDRSVDNLVASLRRKLSYGEGSGSRNQIRTRTRIFLFAAVGQCRIGSSLLGQLCAAPVRPAALHFVPREQVASHSLQGQSH